MQRNIPASTAKNCLITEQIGNNIWEVSILRRAVFLKKCTRGQENIHFFPWFIVYDFESLLLPVNTTQQTIHWKTKHHPIRVSVCSNVTGYDSPTCPDLKVLLKDMVDYITEIATHIYDLVDDDEIFDAPLEADLEKKLEKYKQEVSALGFNSAKYYINLIKMELAKTLKLVVGLK